MLIQSFNTSIDGFKQKAISLDIKYCIDKIERPLVIFCHGFKGFKDWGSFNFISTEFVKSGINFLKFNFSHNGTSLEGLDTFSNLDLFSENNYSIELLDLNCVLEWVNEQLRNTININIGPLILMGHSRGGSIAILKTANYNKVEALISWSAVANFEERFNAYNLSNWKRDGVVLIMNSRTKQNMPLLYQFYQNFIDNKGLLDISNSAKKVNVPWLIVHAKNDNVVPVSDAVFLNKQNRNSNLTLVENGGHTFGAAHPFKEREVSIDLKEAIKKSINFIKSNFMK